MERTCRILFRLLPVHPLTEGRDMIPLSLAGTGDTVTIRRISGRDDVRQHLTELGFIVGDQISVVNELQGDLIVQVKDSRIAVNRGVANHIMVE